MNPKTIRVPAAALQEFMRASFVARGVPPEDAATISDVLIAADLRGIDTHGISRLGYYHARLKAGVTRPGAAFDVVRETTTTAVVDGHHGIGHVIGVRAMRLAMAKAAAHGLGAVAVRNSTHYGIAGYFPLLAVQEGMIGLTTSNARPCAAPTFGVEPLFGTNPLAFGAPTDEACPFLYDAAMTAIQRGKLEVLARKGEVIPAGLVIGEEGQPLTDAADILIRFTAGTAAFLPLGGEGEESGGHKGYGLSIIMEILSAALAGGPFLAALAGGDKEGSWKPYGTGHFFLAVRVESFAPPAQFRKSVGDMMRQLRAAQRAPGSARIWTAGEREWEMEKRRRAEGIPVPPEMQRELLQLRDELALSAHRFPFE